MLNAAVHKHGGQLTRPLYCLNSVSIYVGCLSAGGPAAEAFKRYGSAFRAERWSRWRGMG